MKLNTSFQVTNCQKLTEAVDVHKIHIFYKKQMAKEVASDAMSEEWQDYVDGTSGGNDKCVFLWRKMSWHMTTCFQRILHL